MITSARGTLGSTAAKEVARHDGRWPLRPDPVPHERLSLWNFYYLNACPAPRDPTMVWGTDVDCTALQNELRRINADGDVLVTPAHLLVAATARALTIHPQFNRRVMKRRVWDFRDVNIVMPFQKKTVVGVDVTLFEAANRKSITEIAGEAWRSARAAANGGSGVKEPVYMRFPHRIQALLLPLHVWIVNSLNRPMRETNKRQRSASALVNYLGGKGMPPLRSYKPSRLPYDVAMTTVTMGTIEPRPVAVDGRVIIRPVAPLFIRADHRLVDAHEVGQFTATLCRLLEKPTDIDEMNNDAARFESTSTRIAPRGDVSRSIDSREI